MTNFSFKQFMLQSICLLAIQQSVTADNANSCNTPKLGATDKLVITVFDNQNSFGDAGWAKFCDPIQDFPQGLVTLNYKAGALATGTVDNLKCGSGDCKKDKFYECMKLHSKSFEDCFGETKVSFPEMLMCYCDQALNKMLLDNAAQRAAWKVPESAPAVAVNQVYDPCFKFGSVQDILSYLCQVYQKQVGKCG